MKLDKNGKNLPGWIRLINKNEDGIKQKYYGKYDTV